MRLIWGDRAVVAEQAEAFLDVGLQGLIFNMPSGSTVEDVHRAGEAMAMVRSVRA
jgi:hypothetical protein